MRPSIHPSIHRSRRRGSVTHTLPVYVDFDLHRMLYSSRKKKKKK